MQSFSDFIVVDFSDESVFSLTTRENQDQLDPSCIYLNPFVNLVTTG